MKVLLAEDSAVARKIIIDILEEIEHEVSSYNNGEDALEAILKDDSPDLLILDRTMPKASGLDICNRLTQIGLAEQKYILILSATSDKSLIAEMLNAGANDYVTKPMDKTEFIARIRVAERQILLMNELKTKSDELKSFIKKHDLLSALTTYQEKKVEKKNEGPTYYKIEGKESAIIKKALDFNSVKYFDQIFNKNASTLNLSTNYEKEESFESFFNNGEQQIMSWGSIYIESEKLWIDLLFEANYEDSEELAQDALDRLILPQSEVNEFFSELITLNIKSLSRRLTTENIKNQTYFIPKSTRISNNSPLFSGIKNWLSWDLRVNEIPARIHILPQSISVKEMPSKTLCSSEVIMGAISPSENTEKLLMEAGEVLSENKINQLKKWTQLKVIEDKLPILKPSGLTLKFQTLLEKLKSKK